MDKDKFIKKHSSWFEAHWSKYSSEEQVFVELEKNGISRKQVTICPVKFGYWVAIS